MPYRPYAKRTGVDTLDQVAHGRNMAQEREIRRAINNKIREERRARGDFDPPAPVALRPINIDDASHVIDSWVKSYRKSATVGPVENEVFHIEQRARINRLIKKSRTFIACDEADRSRVRGWIVFEPPKVQGEGPIIHYVCVNPAHQLVGIGTALINVAKTLAPDKDAPLWCTHDTVVMRHVRPKWNLLYNPYLLEVDHRQAAQVATGIAQGTHDYAHKQ